MFRAPAFKQKSCTALLLEQAAVKTEQAFLRTPSLGCDSISDKTSFMPPLRQRLMLLRGWSSVNSTSSSSKSTSYSGESTFVVSTPWLVPYKILVISLSRSVSLKVYAFIAASSQSRSSLDISLNSDGFVPSWCSIDHLNSPFQSTINQIKQIIIINLNLSDCASKYSHAVPFLII